MHWSQNYTSCRALFSRNSARVLAAKKVELRAYLCVIRCCVCGLRNFPRAGFRVGAASQFREVSVIRLDGSLRTAHAGQENIHDGVGGALEFAIAFALGDPG